jgi:uncharacterized protein (DUF302 family)
MVLSKPLHSHLGRPSQSVKPGTKVKVSRDEVAGTAMPWRCWWTGCMAVVMLAAGAARAQSFGQHSRYTHYSTTETVARVVASAQARGLSVVALIPMPGRHAEWLVLGPSPDETAVIQRSPDASIDLPLTLQISEADNGGAEVRFHDGSMPGAHSLPDDLRISVAALPGLIDEALAVQ